jgi:uncharacterized damage-inducible protein DinB
MKSVFMMAIALAIATPGLAQTGAQTPAPAGDPQINAVKVQYGLAKNWVTKASDKMSEELYGFQPTPEVRTYGKVLAHVADANYFICAMSKGEKSPMEMQSIEKTKTTKADIQKALADSYTYCEGAFAALTPAKAAEAVDMFGMPQTRLSALGFVVAHNFEHYGNLVTYMRINKIVPPSSEQQQAPPAPAKTGD